MASRQQRRDRLIFLVPSMTVLAVILFYPLAYSLGLSFYNYYLPVPRTTFVGLDNFRFILGDDAFWEALGVTARFTGAAVTIEVVLGIAVALLLDSRIPCRRFVNTVVLLPMAFVILVVYAGLQSVPVEPLEAAMVDGASRAQTLAHIVFPFLRPLVLFVLIIRSMDAFRIFDQVFVMTGGGPGTTTQTITFYNYVMAFRQLRMGRASALGVITLLILSLVISAWIYLLYRREKGEW